MTDLNERLMKNLEKIKARDVDAANQAELFNQGGDDIKLLQDETQDEAFEGFKKLIERVLESNWIEDSGPLAEDKEEINNLILLIAKWFSYEKTIDNNGYRFGYDFRERVKLNNFSRPVRNWE